MILNKPFTLHHNLQTMKSKGYYLLMFLLSVYSVATAQDRIFTRTYQTSILPQGVMELEFWNTLRTGRQSFQRNIDHRVEFEFGLGGNVQTALYLNVHTKTEIQGDSTLVTRTTTGFSNEWKLKLTDPSIRSFGTALYGEIGVEGNEYELETKLIVDKHLGRNVFAANLISELEYEFEYEKETQKVKRELETPVSLSLAYLRFIGKSFGIGLEATNYNDIEESAWKSSVWYAGPTLHAHGNGWWVNFNLQPQLYNVRLSDDFPQRIDNRHYDRVDARVILSFTL
jgi:hypothetical protein